MLPSRREAQLLVSHRIDEMPNSIKGRGGADVDPIASLFPFILDLQNRIGPKPYSPCNR